MTRQMIEITFGNALTQARQLEDCAADMRRVANRGMNNIKNDLASAWEGDSSSAYIAKMDDTAGNILETAKKIEQIASTLRRVAKIFRDTELKALELLNTNGG